jgi:hypothetical protein
MTDGMIVDGRPAYYCDEDSDERVEVDTKSLRELQWALNVHIDEICTGEHTGHDVINFERLLKHLARDDFNLASIVSCILDQASAGDDGYLETLYALVSVTKTIAQGRCSARQVSRVFATDYPEKFPKL